VTGSDLKELRRMFGFSRRQLAIHIEVHPDTIRYWERKTLLSAYAKVPMQILQELGIGVLDVSTVLRSVRFKRLITHLTIERPRELAEPTPEEGGAIGGNKISSCAAKTRTGSLCQAKPVPGRKRCRMHGGLSTGPKTEAGRMRISRAQKKRRAKECHDQ